MITVSTAALLRMMAILTAGGALTDTTLGLYTNDVALGPGLVPADFTAADYTGYAPISDPIAFGGEFSDSAGNVIQYAEPQIFQPTGTDVANVIKGWYFIGFLNGVGNVLIAAEELPVPVTLASPADALVVVPWLAFNGPVGVIGV